MQSLANELRAFGERIRRMDRGPMVGTQIPPLSDRYPLLRPLQPAQVFRLTCYQCGGAGIAMHESAEGFHWPCSKCRGTGLQCPVCQGKQWLRTTVPATDARDVAALIMRCPDCTTPDYEIEAIVGYIERCSDGAAVLV